MSKVIETQAAVFRGPEAGLVLEQLLVPAPKTGEVLLRVTACGACHSDVHKMHGHGQAPPFVFGHEISGVVEQVGPGVEHLEPRMPVVCSFVASCGACSACRAGKDERCPEFGRRMQREGTRFDGSPRFCTPDGTPMRGSGIGGLARHTVLPASAVFPLPPGADRTDSAVLGCAALTAYGAVHRFGALEPGESAAVIAVGGVGLAITALAARQTELVIGVDLKDSALAAATEFGATAIINSGRTDPRERILELTNDAGVDVVFDSIGLPSSISTALQLITLEGRVVVSGLAGAGESASVPLTELVRRKQRLVGSYAAHHREDMPALLDLVAHGVLDPASLISKRFSFEDAAAAYAAVERGEIVGRALIEIDD